MGELALELSPSPVRARHHGRQSVTLNASRPTEAGCGAAKRVRERLAQEEQQPQDQVWMQRAQEEVQPQEEKLDQVWVRAHRQMMLRRKENWAFGCSSSAAVS